MRPMSFYDKISELNNFIYNNEKDFKGWKLLDVYSDNSGVYIQLFDIGNNETLFIVRGTEITSIKDWQADAVMAKKKIPAQATRAESYYISIRNKYPNIIFTGYSLGANIVQILNEKFGNETICFCPYTNLNNGTNNIINFANKYDPFFMIDPNNVKGKVYLMEPKFKIKSVEDRNLQCHFPWFYGTPSKSTLKTEKLKSESDFGKNLTKMGTVIYDTKQTCDKAIDKYIRNGIIPSSKQLINQLGSKN